MVCEYTENKGIICFKWVNCIICELYRNLGVIAGVEGRVSEEPRAAGSLWSAAQGREGRAGPWPRAPRRLRGCGSQRCSHKRVFNKPPALSCTLRSLLPTVEPVLEAKGGPRRPLGGCCPHLGGRVGGTVMDRQDRQEWAGIRGVYQPMRQGIP